MELQTAKAIISKLDTPKLRAILKELGRSVSSRATVGGLRSRLNRILLSNNREILLELLESCSASRVDSTTNSRPTLRPQRTRARQINYNLDDAEEVYDVPSSFPLHPDVHFKPLPFYEVLGELVKPTTLASHRRDHMMENIFYFHLTPVQAELITKERTPGNDFQEDEFNVQVLLRIGLLETTSAQDDNYPPKLMLWVNREIFPLPTLTPRSSGTDRGCQPLNITRLVKADSMIANSVQMQSEVHFQQYVMSAYLVRKKSWSSLLNQLKMKGQRVAYYTKGLIQQKMNEDVDGIAMTCLRVSLICPLGKMRMQNPCRATTCVHVQCFDASIFLQMNEKKTTWLCPVCDKPAHYENLLIDEYFMQTLTSSKLPSDCREIELSADGSWRPRNVVEAPAIIPSSAPKRTEVHLPSSDDECTVVDEKVKIAEKQPRRARSPAVESIDLVSSSDEENQGGWSLPPKKRSLPPKKRSHNVPTETETVIVTNDEPSPPVIVLESDSEPEQRPPSSSSSSESTPPTSPKPQRRRRKQRFPCSQVPIAKRKNRSPTPPNNSPPASSPLNSSNELEDHSSFDDERQRNPMWQGRRTRRNTPVSYAINKAKSSVTTLVISKRVETNNLLSDISSDENAGDRKQNRKSSLDILMKEMEGCHQLEDGDELDCSIDDANDHNFISEILESIIDSVFQKIEERREEKYEIQEPGNKVENCLPPQITECHLKNENILRRPCDLLAVENIDEIDSSSGNEEMKRRREEKYEKKPDNEIIENFLPQQINTCDLKDENILRFDNVRAKEDIDEIDSSSGNEERIKNQNQSDVESVSSDPPCSPDSRYDCNSSEMSKNTFAELIESSGHSSMFLSHPSEKKSHFIPTILKRTAKLAASTSGEEKETENNKQNRVQGAAKRKPYHPVLHKKDNIVLKPLIEEEEQEDTFENLWEMPQISEVSSTEKLTSSLISSMNANEAMDCSVPSFVMDTKRDFVTYSTYDAEPSSSEGLYSNQTFVRDFFGPSTSAPETRSKNAECILDYLNAPEDDLLQFPSSDVIIPSSSYYSSNKKRPRSPIDDNGSSFELNLPSPTSPNALLVSHPGKKSRDSFNYEFPNTFLETIPCPVRESTLVQQQVPPVLDLSGQSNNSGSMTLEISTKSPSKTSSSSFRPSILRKPLSPRKKQDQ